MTGYPKPDTQIPDTPPQPDSRTGGRWLRYAPPVAALSAAFVLQAILVTDIVGTALTDRYPDTGQPWMWYAIAGLLGISAASSIEAGAAYLMDLYDRHLLARDSVWQLRLGMTGYVAVSGYAIHWWLGIRDLPEVVAWVLAGMSASALWLWSRGSRWRNRQAMVAAGQIDPALPRLPISAKVLHPIRWIVTLYLISWEPASTTAEARARYEAWRSGPHWWRRTPRRRTADTPPRPVRQAISPGPDTGPVPVPDMPMAPVRSIGARTPSPSRRGSRSAVSVEDLARELDRAYPDRIPGVPTAMPHLRQVYGSCDRTRAQAAVRTLSGWRAGQSADDDEERTA